MSGCTVLWPRRLAYALSTLMLTSILAIYLGHYLELHHFRGWSASLSDQEILMRLFVLPVLIAVAVFTLTGCTTARTASLMKEEATTAPVPFQAQVVGLLWLNPLARRDYPTEWQLLWTLGLSRPNESDLQVKDKPQKFSSVQPVAAVVTNQFNDSFEGFFYRYMEVIVEPFSRRYASDPHYFYTVQPQSPSLWRELAGIRVEATLPARKDLRLDEASDSIRENIIGQYGIGRSPAISSRDTPPDVHITVGGPNAGFATLSAALDYLAAHPDETVWVMAWDAPEFPLDTRMSENCVLLVLAGPHYETAREPLAWIGYPASRQLQDFEVQPGLPRAVQAWRAAMTAATDNVGRAFTDTAYLIHDAGPASDAMGHRLRTLGQALSEPLPEFDILRQGFNTPALMGDMGAATSLTNVALAIAYAHHRTVPVLVAGTTGAETAHAVMVTPPQRPRVFDPAKPWFRARGERDAYLPWWGLRHDVDGARVMQGFSH